MKLLLTILALMSTLINLALAATIPAAKLNGILTRNPEDFILDLTTRTALSRVFGAQLAGVQTDRDGLSAICDTDFSGAFGRWQKIGLVSEFIEDPSCEHPNPNADAARADIYGYNSKIFVYQLLKSFKQVDWPYLCNHLSFEALDAFRAIISTEQVINGICNAPKPRPYSSSNAPGPNPNAKVLAGELYGTILAGGATEVTTLNSWCLAAREEGHAEAMNAIGLDRAAVWDALCGRDAVYSVEEVKARITSAVTAIFAMILAGGSFDDRWLGWLNDNFYGDGAASVGLEVKVVQEKWCTE